MVRPEALTFVAAGTAGALPGQVEGRRYAGASTLYRVALQIGLEVEVAVAERGLAAGSVPAAQEGDAVHVAPRPEGPAPRAFLSTNGSPRPTATAGPRDDAP